jgi:uncharacterized membrane protein
MNLTVLRGPEGHPLHPPLTDATIGAYTVAAALAVLGFAGVAEHRLATGWWLALVAGLGITILTALTGFIDWLAITRGTALWRTATSHMIAMLAASSLFLVAAIVGHSAYSRGHVSSLGLALTLSGFVLLTLGGWLGGSIVFVYGMRVLGLPEEPAIRAVNPFAAKRDG